MAVLFLIAAAALASASESPPPSSKADSITITGVKERKVCRSEVPTGSIVPKRICRTAVEWEAQRLARRRVIDELSQQAYQRHLDLTRRQQNRDGE